MSSKEHTTSHLAQSIDLTAKMIPRYQYHGAQIEYVVPGYVGEGCKNDRQGTQSEWKDKVWMYRRDARHQTMLNSKHTTSSVEIEYNTIVQIIYLNHES